MNASFKFAQRTVNSSRKSGCFNFRATTTTTSSESFAQKFSKQSTSTSTSSSSSSIPSFGSYANFSSNVNTFGNKNSIINSAKTTSANGFPFLEVLCLIDAEEDDDR
ncbi:hypothetical protein RB653_010084 [Dictyostelium firmibasis]|uniref:Uncharacterized protein n=1 Tax=Dictyostelium firmibasis TaxID=79012 RepID=A0AAN7TYR2_9MYCE